MCEPTDILDALELISDQRATIKELCAKGKHCDKKIHPGAKAAVLFYLESCRCYWDENCDEAIALFGDLSNEGASKQIAELVNELENIVEQRDCLL